MAGQAPPTSGPLAIGCCEAPRPFEFIGESAITVFADNQVKHWQMYCYEVQAHNNGALSPLSAPVCGALPLEKVYLPFVSR